ncbi:hypothetical protein JRC04_05485 [Mycolicibacterium sp. S2-37]|uniref:hypothetical protein n=1 Tax=Mycolicibacterium sp. S2-37 TaxID=2810297 RepID=UPI001A94C8F5|nr:hypothetical protein [Mycolicibacterium sp. S2-37]MBO0676908.1 hypothetical protein [Mycolicibacterium sp. S2-37]
MTYTVEDLDAAVLAHYDEDEDYQEGWGNLGEALYHYNWGVNKDKPAPTVELDGIGTVRKVEDFGGEGQGDQYWIVISITDADGNVRYFQRDGWYASYDGGYYEGPTFEVRPEEKTITVWVKA